MKTYVLLYKSDFTDNHWDGLLRELKVKQKESEQIEVTITRVEVFDTEDKTVEVIE
jgi:hypothetical protein